MECTLKELADLVGGEVAGEPSTRIRGVAGIREAQPGDITFLSNHRYAPLLNSTHASAVVVGDNKKKVPIPAITVRNADWAFAKIAQHFQAEEDAVVPGVHPTAVVCESARLGKDVSIGALCFVGENAEIGEGTVLHPQAYIGRSVRIGAQCLLYPQVVVRERCLVGSRVILHSGCVVGADGFGFVTLEGRHEKIPQVGIVIVEDDVEIGANVTIDRARFDKTVIGRGTKIDNLVQIAHNVTLGAHNLVAAQVGIAGSTRLGQYVAVGAQAGIVGHLEIGDGTMIGAQSGVTKGTPPGSVISGGLKAMDHQQHLRQVIASEKLPTLLRDFRKLRERVKQLERELEKQKKP